ncbi:Gfo/Idh/MocA family protein [Streptacidiphilus jiangxiensis]|uniref:Predicted dehydrogenase n=1 Tax=Streptacidiphilus jiangxiensis TaxID=235985 RepID=A0A1H7XLL8_STRJI|nr:Gfo/Idh/MocA family oxidoreductase [Streptacidiphilus jiangxiensis]SEM33889.1 Predicted dehydrogenase [Streptacidiphilus jiangxiensis]
MGQNDVQDNGRARGPLGVAVVGAGYWGPNLVRNFQACDRFRLRWLCDLDEARARRVLGGYSTVQTTADLGEVLADPEVDAVAVATPAGTHLDVALAALRAGKHVLVEKPLAATYADGLRLVEEAEQRGLTLMCDHTYCYTPAVGRIRELVLGGELGELHYVDSVRINLGLVQKDIDVLWDLAPHDLSILDVILPEHVRPVAVAAHGADPIGAGQACVAYLTLQLSTGAIAHVHVNWLSPTKVRTTMVGGAKRTLVWDDLNPGQRVAVFDRGVDLAAPQEIGAEERRDMLISYRSGDMVAPALAEREALRSMVEEFAEAITTGRPPLTDGRSGLRVLDILEAASRSLAYHGAVVGLRTGH